MTKFLFSRKKKSVGTYKVPPSYTIHYRFPKIRERNKLKGSKGKAGYSFISKLDDYNRARQKWREDNDFPAQPSYDDGLTKEERREKIASLSDEAFDEYLKAENKRTKDLHLEWQDKCHEREQELVEQGIYFTYDLSFTNEEIDALIDYFMSLTTDVEGLEDEQGPFEWKDLNSSQQRDFYETVLNPISLVTFYYEIKHTVDQTNVQVMKDSLRNLRQDALSSESLKMSKSNE